MKLLIGLLICVISIITSNALGQSDDYILVNRISPRVAVFTEKSSINNNVIAIQTIKGIVVIDAMCSPITAGRVRELIVREFNRSDFAYLINTHHDFDHSWGNQVFGDAEIVGHASFKAELIDDTRDISETIESNKRHRQKHIDELKNSNPEPERKKYLNEYIAFRTRFIDGISENFTATPPTITFKDTLTLDLIDIHVKIFYVGPAHSISDLFIFIPEEEILMTGDIFMDRLFLPYFASQDELNVPNFLKVLSILLDGEYSLKLVIPGHKEFWDKKKLILWRDYIADLWESVNKAKEQGLTNSEFIANYPINEDYMYLKELGHSDNGIQKFHNKNIKAFWKQKNKL